ncbi:hypothetical protein [Pseudomonas sp. 22 E 5]|nr:hypothetical protein [Pseudomonas sp. 22 E 5]
MITSGAIELWAFAWKGRYWPRLCKNGLEIAFLREIYICRRGDKFQI